MPKLDQLNNETLIDSIISEEMSSAV